MIRSELVARITDEIGKIPLERASEILDVFFGTMLDHLCDGGRVEIRGFGSFNVGTISGANHHNPVTLERLPPRPAIRRVRFRPSSMLTLNGGPVS